MENENPSTNKINPYIKWIIVAVILLFATLPFHYVPSHMMIFPKDHFTFSYTIISQDDIEELVERYNKANFFEKNAMNNEPIIRKLKEKGLIYDKTLQDDEDQKLKNDADAAANALLKQADAAINENNKLAEETNDSISQQAFIKTEIDEKIKFSDDTVFKNEQLKIFSNTNKYIIDTILKNIEIHNKPLTIIMVRDKIDLGKIDDISQCPLSLIVFDDNEKKILCNRKLESSYYFTNYSFHHNQNSPSDSSKFFLTINTSAGGSGSADKLYSINYNNDKIILNKLFETGELSYIIFNKNFNKIILLKGIWEEGESHFEKHRFILSKYLYKDSRFYKNDIGTTKFKYECASFDEKSVLSEIKTKEPLLMESISIDDYYFTQ